MAINVLLLKAPGTNCEEETAYAFRLAGARPEIIHLNRVLEQPTLLKNFQILCIPGGFSFGDDLGAGRVFAGVLSTQLGDDLEAFRDEGKIILGICNGFQVLIQTHLLAPRVNSTSVRKASLAWNHQGRYEDRWVHLRFEKGLCPFLADCPILAMPIAHGEGRFVVDSPETLADLESKGHVVARYVDESGKQSSYPINPNGSVADIAGLCDKTGRVVGMMPHPERHLLPYQHPNWTRRREQPEFGDGLVFYRSAVQYFA